MARGSNSGHQLLPPPADWRPMSAVLDHARRQTRPIQNKSNMMFNFVALASENDWLRDLQVKHTARPPWSDSDPPPGLPLNGNH